MITSTHRVCNAPPRGVHISRHDHPRNMDPRLVKGKDDAQRQLNATMVAEHLTAKMGGIPLTLLVNAVEVTPDAIDEDECYECIKTIGIDSQLLSSALFKARPEPFSCPSLCGAHS